MAIRGKESRPAKIFETMKVGGSRSLRRTAMLDETPMAKATGSSTRSSTKKSPNRKRVIRRSAGRAAAPAAPPRSQAPRHGEALHDHEGRADRDAEVDDAHRPLERRGVLAHVLRRQPEPVDQRRSPEKAEDERAVHQANDGAHPGRQPRGEEVHAQVGALADREAGDQEHRPDPGEARHLLAPRDDGEEGEVAGDGADEGRAEHDADGHDDERRDQPVIAAAQHAGRPRLRPRRGRSALGHGLDRVVDLQAARARGRPRSARASDRPRRGRARGPAW